jgi:peptidylprolyl isomerase
VQAGEVLQLDVPADLAYGNDSFPADSVPSGSAMSFVISVAAVVPATTEDDAPSLDDLPLTTTPATDIITDDVIEGDGAELTTGMTAVVNVIAVCATNGAVLQNTWGDDQREFIDTTDTSAILPGLLTGILDMQVGGRRVITLPASMAYADKGNRELGIGPDRDLIYVVDLYAAIGVPPTGT